MAESDNEYVLAMYDIRGKQEFIFRDNKIKAIMGGSELIADLFNDYLYEEACRVREDGSVAKITGDKLSNGIFHEKNSVTKKAIPFTRNDFKKHLEAGYIGEIIYDGGGNFQLLFKNKTIFKEVNYLFTKKVVEKIGTLKVLATCIENVDFDHYRADQTRLYEKHQYRNNTESISIPWGTLPIVQIDNRTSLPLTDIRKNEENQWEKLSKESAAKYKKFDQRKKEEQFDEKILDKMVTEKGKESLLAVIYIDGNSMGAKVENCVREKETYEESIAALRNFSESIQKYYIDDRLEDIDKCLKDTDSKGGKRRIVVRAGDEISFICNARDAFWIMKVYMDGLISIGDNSTSCAGIAIFHSHMPYSEAYRIAEECCENAKKTMKDLGWENACFVDFHFCQGAIGTSLEEIRRQEHNEACSKPWLLWTDQTDIPAHIADLDTIEKMSRYLHVLGRTNVKNLAEAAQKSQAALELELLRIEAHMSIEEKSVNKESIDFIKRKTDPVMKKKLIYDMIPVYDIWFDKEGKEKE